MTREIPAFGGISLALHGSGTFGAPVGAPSAPPLGHLRRPFGKPPPSAAVKEIVIRLGRHGRPIFGVPGAPRTGRQLTPPSATK